MAGGGGGGNQKVETKPWEGVRDYLVNLYKDAANLAGSHDMTPLQALPIDQRMQKIAQLWGGNPGQVANQYGFSGGMLSQPMSQGGALDGPPLGNPPPPVPNLNPPRLTPDQVQQATQGVRVADALSGARPYTDISSSGVPDGWSYTSWMDHMRSMYK